ncbi:MAG TPA: hypothetical protein PLL69_02640 [Gemmatimonadales bacterium]|nr:hypothetical protein [Gemmatimonadales bacterium]
MLEFRKLRAVLLLALVSSVAWGLLIALINLGVELFSGRPLTIDAFTRPFLAYAALGFLMGLVFGVAIALIGVARGQRELSMVRATSFGALGGAVMFQVVWLGLYQGALMGSLSAIIAPTAVFALLGAGTGLAIRAAAGRGRITDGSDTQSDRITS